VAWTSGFGATETLVEVSERDSITISCGERKGRKGRTRSSLGKKVSSTDTQTVETETALWFEHFLPFLRERDVLALWVERHNRTELVTGIYVWGEGMEGIL